MKYKEAVLLFYEGNFLHQGVSKKRKQDHRKTPYTSHFGERLPREYCASQGLRRKNG